MTISGLDELVAQARSRARLDDLGTDGWQDGLVHLLDAARSDLPPDADSEARLEQNILSRLDIRLRTEDWYADREAEPPPISGLVVIHGLPRTATTALQFLLAIGPTFRFQRRWEISSPVPPAGSISDDDDPRRLAALAKDSGGGGSVQHIASVDGPADDGQLLGLGFHNQELGLPLPSYTRWWRSADLTTTYAYHERILRMLHTRRPPHHWLVKAPYHNFHLDDLARQYPEAMFVMAHRDPALALPSTCSTVETAQRNALPNSPPDPEKLGRFLLEHLVDGIGRAMRARQSIGEHRFIDIAQKEVETDAVGVAERIYRFLGLELDGSTRAAMAEWSVANPPGARGKHAYSPEEYGLTGKEIREAFRDYIDRFEIQSETG